MNKIAGFEGLDNPSTRPQQQSSLPGRDQQQQWLLMLEKAYLKLQQGDLGRHREVTVKPNPDHRHEPKTPPAVPTTPSPEPSASLAPRIEQTAAVIVPSASQTSAAPSNPAPSQDLAMARVKLAANPGSLAENRVRAETASTSLKTVVEPLRSALAAKIPELNSATIMKTEQGLHLVIRDRQPGDLSHLTGRIRQLFNQLNLPLARITINGKTAWTERHPPDSTPADNNGSTVNKVY